MLYPLVAPVSEEGRPPQAPIKRKIKLIVIETPRRPAGGSRRG